MRLTLALLLIIAGWAVRPAPAQEGLVFRASFDTGHTPEIARGGDGIPFVERNPQKDLPLAPGKLGQAVQVAKGRQLVYEGEGNAYTAAGTIAFFWRPDEDPTGKGFLILDLSPLERINYSRFLKIHYGQQTLGAIGTLGSAGGRGLSVHAYRNAIKAGEWRHLALAWDQARGMALYVDGKLGAEYKGAWSYEGHFNHIGLGIETRPDFRPSGAQFSQSYDELAVYDRWLSDAEIAELAAGKLPQPSALDPAGWCERKRAVNGWGDPAGLKPILALKDGPGLGLRQAGVAHARDVKRSNWMIFDGERARRWPGSNGYYNRGRALEINLEPGESFDVVQILGSGEVSLVKAGSDQALAGLPYTEDRHPATVHTMLEAPASGEHFQLTRPWMTDPETQKSRAGAVYQMSLFRTVPYDPRADAGADGWERLGLTAMKPEGPEPPEAVHIRRLAYPSDQDTLYAVPRGAGETRACPAMRAVHLLGPASPERRGLGALALDLAIAAGAETNVLRVDVFDPLNPERYAVTADVKLAGSAGRLRLMLDLRDLVLMENVRPHLALTFRDDTRIDLAASAVAFRWQSVDAALPQFAHDQLARARDIFQEISESRPWGYPPEKLKTLRFLLNGIDTLRALMPDDEVVGSYWHWVHPREKKKRAEFPEPPPGIPAWAVYLDGAIEANKKVPYWWIANRENDVGEFGANDGINDDTDLVMDWWALQLMRGPDPVLFESLKRVAENSWFNKMRESGLGGYTDALHTHEDGPNAQAHMALMEYGNPVRMERLFKFAAHYKDMLAVHPKCGHLHFKAADYGCDKEGKLLMRTGPGASDEGANALALQPGMLIAWYNGNPACVKTVVDWTDGMMAHQASQVEQLGRLVSAEVYTDSGDVRTNDTNPGFGYGFFNAPWFAWEFTGARKYLEHIRLGMERDLRDYRHLRQTGQCADRYIQETGDTSLKDRHVAAAKMPYLWESSIHNDDYLDIDSFYVAWQCTGDMNFLTEGLKLSYNDILWELPMLTVGEQSTDRVWLPQRLLNRVALGGPAMLRNELYPKHAVSWERASGRLAPMVRLQDRKRFEVWIVNLEEKEASVDLRVWRLDHGRYEWTEGADADQDGAFDAPGTLAPPRTLELARFDAVPLKIPPRTVWFVTCKQLEALDDLRARPDLAVCVDDVAYDAQAGELVVRVHNIGAKASGAYGIRITVGDHVALEQETESLEAPADLLPKIAEFRVAVPDGAQTVRVELDAARKIPEIVEVNNEVSFVPAKLPPPWPITRK
ncbi:MAG: hypothetical protein M5U26_12260 [Planctomycetota bacterium]|nr:hypothetical protein [Planctomycetota bacterium]